MYRERLVECGDCGDRFKIIYDSRKERQDTYKCKCGKLKVYPDNYGSYGYDRGGNSKKLSYEEYDSKLEYYEEDYIRLSENELKLFNEIDKIGLELKENHYGIYTNLSDENGIYLHLDGCSKLNEGLTISLEIRLQSFGEGWRQNEISNKHERIVEGLNRFKDVITKVQNKEIDLDNPRKIWDDDSLEWNDGTRSQQKIYDYELCC
jgi:hypothetical protein